MSGVPGHVLVLGGAGFIGRHAVAGLLATKTRIVVGSRQPANIDARLPTAARAAPRREVRLERTLRAADWHALIDDVDVVLNCVGILRQRGAETYDKVHHLAPAALAQACAERGKRFVHVSALGLNHPARSRFLTSKLAGERAIEKTGAQWFIARPSLLDGTGGYGAWWLRAVSRLPIFAVPSGGPALIAPLDVAELGEALARLCLTPLAELNIDRSRVFELGGPVETTFAEYIRALRRTKTPRRSIGVRVPSLAARAVAHLCDALHLTPFSFGHWELLRHDNVPRPNRLPELLGRTPTAIGEYPTST